ncbi:hypothetical protein ElyMa_007008800 [Elysia marginata]|uniref:Uncharacterized protein n=1 Tax=Elysia marginata TaxID=1093978 RepID=A0AAV4JPM5_9GAST|nr:hypothetical protein ElyMa_007008800 [Elysia marginata]
MSDEAAMLVNWRLASSEGGVEALARINGCRAVMAAAGGGSAGHDGKCGMEECSRYCHDSDKGDHGHDGHGGVYDAAPKMAAGWVAVVLAGLLSMVFSF